MSEQDGLIIFVALACVVLNLFIGYCCGVGRGRGGAGILLAFMFGPVGWVIALLLPPNILMRRRRY